ncbi:alpha/beta fold hydrolase [Planktotalea sp.]|uniref:alpha/beta fold hydrolase n=1 Tax=Planktotalea sp. TaxID=2029877 RepID=UPI003D6A0A41
MLRILLSVVILFAIFAALTAWRAQQRETMAEDSYPPEGQFVDVNGHRVHGVVRGSGPDLVLIHGASSSTRDYTFSLLAQLEKHYRVIVLDRPGLGYSEPMTRDGESLPEQAALLSQAAAKLGAKKPIVLGHSFGGAVALAWALHHPENISALVLVSAPSNDWQGPVDLLYRVNASWFGATFLVPVMTAWTPQTYVENAFDQVYTPQAAPEGFSDYFGASITLRRKTMVANARQRIRLMPDIREMIPRYGEIKTPTEILHGDQDKIVGLSIHSELLVDQLDDAELTVLNGIGHGPLHSAEREVIDAIHRAASRAGLR